MNLLTITILTMACLRSQPGRERPGYKMEAFLG